VGELEQEAAAVLPGTGLAADKPDTHAQQKSDACDDRQAPS
jgi:hypothetical protein